MKRVRCFKGLVIFLVVAAVISSCGMTALAGNTQLEAVRDSVDIGVFVKYVDNTNWNTVSTDENGNGSIVLPDGTEATLSGADPDVGQLVIDRITEKKALNWIGSILDGGKKLQAFHICYLKNGKIIQKADNITVTLKLHDTLSSPVAYTLSTDGACTALPVTEADGCVTFTTTEAPYYIFGEEDVVTLHPETSAPKTGDNQMMACWISLLLISGGVLTGMGVLAKKKRSI